MIKIYGSPKSSSGRCFWTLEEVGQTYEAKPINFKEKEHKSKAYLKINPNGKVPSLTDGDYTIWESMAINMYLAEAYKPELIGEDAKERGHVYQWSIWAITDLQTPLIDIFIQLVFVPDEKKSMETIEKAQAKIPALLNTVERALDNSKYLAGEKFTLADLNTLSVISVCDLIKYDLSSYKNIISWKSVISERPAFKKYMQLCEQ
jgi:glutathione S-transferase